MDTRVTLLGPKSWHQLAARMSPVTGYPTFCSPAICHDDPMTSAVWPLVHLSHVLVPLVAQSAGTLTPALCAPLHAVAALSVVPTASKGSSQPPRLLPKGLL